MIVRTPSAVLQAWERITNYNLEHLHKLFRGTEHRDQDGSQWEMMGHSQTMYNPDSTEDEEGCTDNLFDRFEEVADERDAKYTSMERKLRSFLSMYGALGKDEQTVADDRVDFLLSQTRADYAKRQKVSGGTRSIIAERHSIRSRTFNTHNSYYK